MVHPLMQQRKGNIVGVGKDSDRDGVKDFIDCQPFNSRKQGMIHDAFKKVKGTIVGTKKQRRKAIREMPTKAPREWAEHRIQKAYEKAYLEAVEKEAPSEARQRARVEREVRIKKYKQRVTPRSSTSPRSNLVGLGRYVGMPMGSAQPSRRTRSRVAPATMQSIGAGIGQSLFVKPKKHRVKHRRKKSKAKAKTQGRTIVIQT